MEFLQKRHDMVIETKIANNARNNFKMVITGVVLGVGGGRGGYKNKEVKDSGSEREKRTETKDKNVMRAIS